MLDDGLGELASPTQVAVPGASCIDPPLYLGALLLRQGQAKDALRYLTEANRIDGNCPIVTVQLGAAMIAAGGDMQMAVRALQRPWDCAACSSGLTTRRTPGSTAFRKGARTSGKLASSYAYVCPLWGADLGPLLQQANLAWDRGFTRWAPIRRRPIFSPRRFTTGAPSLAVLRGLGRVAGADRQV